MWRERLWRERFLRKDRFSMTIILEKYLLRCEHARTVHNILIIKVKLSILHSLFQNKLLIQQWWVRRKIHVKCSLVIVSSGEIYIM